MSLTEIMDTEIKRFAEQYKAMKDKGERARYDISLQVFDFISKMTPEPEMRIHYANMYYDLRK